MTVNACAGLRARRIVDGLAAPLWCGYVAAHVEDPPMVHAWLRAGSGDRVARYRRLLDEPLLPSDLRATLVEPNVPVGATLGDERALWHGGR